MIILSFILQMQEVRLGGPKSRGDCPSARGAPRRRGHRGVAAYMGLAPRTPLWGKVTTGATRCTSGGKGDLVESSRRDAPGRRTRGWRDGRGLQTVERPHEASKEANRVESALWDMGPTGAGHCRPRGLLVRGGPRV